MNRNSFTQNALIKYATIFIFFCGQTASALDFTDSKDKTVNRGTFLLPNEMDTYLYKPLTKGKKDILLSVGTFRALFLASMGDFSRLIMFDHDVLVTKFNNNNLLLIKCLGELEWPLELQRMQYIALLNYKYLSDEQITNMQSSIYKNDFDQIKILMKNLRSMPLINLDDVAPKLRPIVEEIHIIFQLSAYRNRNFEMPRSEYQRVYTSRNIFKEFLKSLDRFEVIYWGSNEKWKKIQDMIESDKIMVINGNLSGEYELKALSEELKANNEKISIMDVSNAPIAIAFSEIQAVDEDASKEFVNNLTYLPFAKNSYLLSSEVRDIKVYEWFYYHIEIETLFNCLKIIDEKDKNYCFYKVIKEHSRLP